MYLVYIKGLLSLNTIVGTKEGPDNIDQRVDSRLSRSTFANSFGNYDEITISDDH